MIIRQGILKEHAAEIIILTGFEKIVHALVLRLKRISRNLVISRHLLKRIELANHSLLERCIKCFLLHGFGRLRLNVALAGINERRMTDRNNGVGPLLTIARFFEKAPSRRNVDHAAITDN